MLGHSDLNVRHLTACSCNYLLSYHSFSLSVCLIQSLFFFGLYVFWRNLYVFNVLDLLVSCVGSCCLDPCRVITASKRKRGLQLWKHGSLFQLWQEECCKYFGLSLHPPEEFRTNTSECLSQLLRIITQSMIDYLKNRGKELYQCFIGFPFALKAIQILQNNFQ